MTGTAKPTSDRPKALTLILGLVMCGCAPAAGQAGETPPDPRPTIFTQVHDQRVQSITSGNRFEVQLPGAPAVWRRDPKSESRNLEFLGQTRFPSPNRIPETSGIQAFAYRVTAPGPVTLTLTSDPPAPLPKGGTFNLLLQAD